MIKIALAQFAVSRAWEDNATTCLDFMSKASQANARLLILPEGILARDIADPALVRKAAQPLDGPFMAQILEASRANDMTTVMCIHNPSEDGRVWNNHIAVRSGQVIAQYYKLHLYDAFSAKESTEVIPGDSVPPLVEIDGLKVGLMTCYDVRFPEMARRLADDGAELIVVSAAWHKGPLKEMHWNVMCTARALENTCYLAGVGECGERNIGASLVVDPLGVVISSAGEQSTILYADIDPNRLAYARTVLPVLVNRRFARPVLINETLHHSKSAGQ